MVISDSSYLIYNNSKMASTSQQKPVVRLRLRKFPDRELGSATGIIFMLE